MNRRLDKEWHQIGRASALWMLLLAGCSGSILDQQGSERQAAAADNDGLAVFVLDPECANGGSVKWNDEVWTPIEAAPQNWAGFDSIEGNLAFLPSGYEAIFTGSDGQQLKIVGRTAELDIEVGLTTECVEWDVSE